MNDGDKMDEINEHEIGRLLRLKRHEQPPPGYFEDFLHEFQRRQRDELLRQSLWQIAWHRAQDFMLRLDVARIASYPVAVAAVLVCATVMSVRIYQAPAGPKVAALSPAITVPAALSSGGNLNMALRLPISNQPNTAALSRPVFNPNLSTRRKATPPRYVLDSMPVSYESTLRF